VHRRRQVDAEKPFEALGDTGNRVDWNFKLANHRVGRGQSKQIRRQQLIGTGSNYDLVFPGPGYCNQRCPGRRALQREAAIEINTTIAQHGERFIGCGICTDTRDQRDISPKASCSECLVSALAARKPVELGTRYGFAGRRKPINCCDKIEIDRTDNNNSWHGIQSPKRASLSVSNS